MKQFTGVLCSVYNQTQLRYCTPYAIRYIYIIIRYTLKIDCKNNNKHTQTHTHTHIHERSITQMSVVRIVKLRVSAGIAKPGPAIGQALGPLGVNMAEFCKQFNDKSISDGWIKETPLAVRLSAMSDRSFKFTIRSPPTPYLIKQVLGMTKGPSKSSADVATAYITPEMVYEIAKLKMNDEFAANMSLEGLCHCVIGTCRSMGIQVKEDDSWTDGHDDQKAA
jgi:large subunit ribosomal protein L11